MLASSEHQLVLEPGSTPTPSVFNSHGYGYAPVFLGKRTIFHSSYTGGDRFMQLLSQDSMAIVRHFGRPTLFMTFTANPKWEEILQELLPGQSAVDRPDLVARLFHLE